MQKSDILGWAGVYGFWVVTIALAILILIVSRQTAGIAAEVAGLDPQARTLIDRVILFVVAVMVVVLIVFIEHYYRVGLGKGLLLKRASRVLGIELLVLAVLHTIPQLLLGLYGGWLQRGVILVEGAAGFALIAVSIRLKRGPKRPMHHI